MPGFLTHYLFSINTFHALEKKSMQQIIKEHKQVYFLGSQGPDIFFYYLPCNLNPKKQLGGVMHHTTTNDFFESCFRQIPTLPTLPEQEIALAYVAGFLCHYTLDSICHPFIYGRTGYAKYMDEPKTPLSYSAQHCEYETKIDTTMLKRLKDTAPSKLNYAHLLKLKKMEVHVLSHFLTDTINTTYFKENGYSYVNEAFIKRTLRYMPIELRFLQDKCGHKKDVVTFLEKHTVHFHLLSSLMTSDALHEEDDVLNLQKQSWKSPWVPEQVENDSFLELFDIAIQSGSYRLDYLYSLWDAKREEDTFEKKIQHLLTHLGNLSYNSGLSCTLDTRAGVKSPKREKTCSD